MFQDDSKSETSVPMYWKQFCWFLKSSTFSECSFYSVVRGMDSTSAGKQGSPPVSPCVYEVYHSYALCSASYCVQCDFLRKY